MLTARHGAVARTGGILFKAPDIRRLSAERAGCGGQIPRPRPFGDLVGNFVDQPLRGLAHHVGIYDIGVVLALVHSIILVGANLIIFTGVRAQVYHAIAAHAAHAVFEVAGFVFVWHDADAAVLGISGGRVYGLKAVFLRQQQGLEPKIGFEWIVLFKYADT